MDRALALASWQENYEKGTSHNAFQSILMLWPGARLRAPENIRSFQLRSHLLRWFTARSLLGNNELVCFAV